MRSNSVGHLTERTKRMLAAFGITVLTNLTLEIGQLALKSRLYRQTQTTLYHGR